MYYYNMGPILLHNEYFQFWYKLADNTSLLRLKSNFECSTFIDFICHLSPATLTSVKDLNISTSGRGIWLQVDTVKAPADIYVIK